jgi:phosphoglucosamine mutase
VPLSRLAHFYEPFPQVLINVEVPVPESLGNARELWGEIERAEESLGSEGRVLVRASGTERVVRVMVEAPMRATAERVAKSLASAVRSHLAD